MSESEPKKEEKTVKIEKAAEDMGELVGQGIRKTWHITKSFGKGVLDSLEKKEEQITLQTVHDVEPLLHSIPISVLVAEKRSNLFV